MLLCPLLFFPAMFSRFCVQFGLLAVTVSIAHAMIMVESVDGSFVPWHLLPRAPGGSVPVRLTNNNDVAYLVGLLHFLREQSD